MHVANVLGYMANRYGGPPKSMYGMGQAITGHGCEISYWATTKASDQDDLVASGPSVHLYETVWPHGWFRAPALVDDLVGRISSIDLFHIQGMWSYPQLSASRIARRFDVPYLITPRGVLAPWHIRRKSRVKFFKKMVYFALAGKSMLRSARCLHAVASKEVEGFRQIGYDGPVTIVPNGINPRDFNELPPREEAEAYWPDLRNRRVILFLSRLSKEKGLDQFLPALANVVRGSTYKDVLLVLAGSDLEEYSTIVNALVTKNRLSEHVLFTGMVEARRKAQLISRADIYALPSHAEGFSLSLLENLASGKPVLITNGCNFPEVARSGAGFCVPAQQGPLEEGLKRLLDMSALDLASMGQKGRELVLENYTWDVAGRKMITVYKCILEGREIPLYPSPFMEKTNESRTI